ncbi:MAG: D-alanyl-D-alanine carboxypeptidase/D-alanyl-D-alanine-endopeptidase [Phycisphaerales bacterium]|nr:D-alanyl-D-alanine carboxypeptidase/D-alanyl-D-alanine-endopeptidase [Phycisphaerales bacterium]
MRSRRFASVAVLLVVVATALPASAQTLQQQIDDIFDALPGSHTLSGRVESADGSVVYYSHDADVGKKPASVTKFFVVGATMSLLGPDHRFVTRVYRDGTIDGNGVLTGDLILLGNHDFTWTTDYYAGNARFALDMLAQQLYDQGLRSVTGTVRGFGYLMYAEVPSNADAVVAFRDALLDAGISVSATATSTSFSPPGVAIAEWRSMPLSQACRDLMKVSDNDDAQALLRHLAYELHGSSSDSTGEDVVQAWLEDHGVDMTGSVFLEGAGLSHSNRVSALQGIGLTRTVLNSPEGWYVTSALPIGGVDGTLSSRFASGPADGLVHAKTGTLTGVVTLNGYVQNPIDHERYYFAFLMNDISGFTSTEGRDAIDSAVELLVGDINQLGGSVPGAATLRSVVGNSALGTADVTWTAATGATSYRVERSATGGAWTLDQVVSGTSATIAGLTLGDAEYVRVRAVNANGMGPVSDAYGVRISRTPHRILIVDGNDRWAAGQTENPEQLNHEFAIRYGEAVTAAVRFDTCANEAVTGAQVDLPDYAAVLWLLGEESTVDVTFSATEQSLVGSYLLGGGNLFVSGAEIGWDLDWLGSASDRTFYNGTLHADYVADDAGTYRFAGSGGIFADLPIAVGDFHPMWMDVGFPDVIAPVGGAVANLEYISDAGASAGVAGIQYAGSYRLVHLGFPFDAIGHLGMRRMMMNRVLGFLLDTEFPDDVIVEARDLAGDQVDVATLDESGAWADSSAKSQADDLAGTGSRFITYDLPNAGSDHASITPDIPVDGRYEVFVTWGQGANCNDAQYTIRHADGVDVTYADQIPRGTSGENAHTWVSLGAYAFSTGADFATGSVEVSEAAVSGKPSATWNQRVYFDALKLVLRERDALGVGDFDGDGDIDLSDFTIFVDCMSGPDTPYLPGCEPCDVEADGDVDLADYSTVMLSSPTP